MCELCFVEHGITTKTEYKCILNLDGKIIKLCHKCKYKNELVIVSAEKVEENDIE